MPQSIIPRIQSVSLKRNNQGQFLVLWGATEKELPPRPEQMEILSPSDRGFWYDREYAGWNNPKLNIPESPRDGAAGKRLVYLEPGQKHPYMNLYTNTIIEKCRDAGIDLTILSSQWSDIKFDENVDRAIAMKPDMILLNPEHQEKSNGWYKRINEAGIPVVGGNFLADNEGHQYLLAWTGPDDWGQSRLLARTLADRMEKKGGYAILQHFEGNSSFYARTWGPVTELKEYAPDMVLLDTKPGMIPLEAAQSVHLWIDKFGKSLQGIFCADDGETMREVAGVLKDRGREDIVCVATGSSSLGMELIMKNELYASSYQSAVIDGETAIQTIIDWFEGLPVEPVRYLPKHIVTAEDASDFLNLAPQVNSLNLEHLYTAIREFNWKGSYNFFGDLYSKLLKNHVIPSEMFQGICLEILTGMIVILKTDGISVEDSLGSYDVLVKHLFKDNDIGSVLEWLNNLCQQLIAAKLAKINRMTPIQEIIEYIDYHYMEPLSLKSLAYQFSISQAYLGQVFRKETGTKFNDYLNGKRVEKAKLSLLGENVAINKVAVELGYTDPAYFYKIFKKLTGLSASDYINQNK